MFALHSGSSLIVAIEIYEMVSHSILKIEFSKGLNISYSNKPYHILHNKVGLDILFMVQFSHLLSVSTSYCR